MNAEEIFSQDALDSNDPKTFTMLLWNDETHTFVEVARKCETSLGCSSAEGRQIATNVDEYVIPPFYFRAALY
jgi:hypothetical protein